MSIIRTNYQGISRLFCFVIIMLLSSSPLYSEDKIVAHWSFDSTDQSSTYFDVSQNGYDATTGKYSVVPSVKGNGLLCNSSANNVTIAKSTTDFNLPAFTVEAMIFSNAALVNPGSFENMRSVFEYTDCSSDLARGYALQIMDNGCARFAMANQDTDSWTICEGGDALKKSTWYHLAGCYDGKSMRLFVNGKLVREVTAPASYPFPTVPARIGSQLFQTDIAAKTGRIRIAFDGIIDEVMLYNYSLTGDTIAAHYNSYDIPAPERKLLAHWSFDSSLSNTTFYDVTRSGYDAKCTKPLSIARGVKNNALESTVKDYTFFVDKSYPDFSVSNFTVEGWFYSYIDLVNVPSFYNYKMLFSYQSFYSGFAKGYGLDINSDGTIQIAVSANSSTWTICKGTTVLKPNTWYHVAATYDGTALKVYTNGTLENTLPLPAGYDYPDQNAGISCQASVKTGEVRNWFNGKIDELKLYNYALEPNEVKASWESNKPLEEPAFEINLGMKSTHARPGDTIVMPLYLANFEEFSISALQMTLTYDSTRLKLESISKDSGMVKQWQLFDWNTTTPGNIPVALAGEETKIGYGEGELYRCIFTVAKNLVNGDTCIVSVNNVKIDEKNNLVVASVQDGRVIISTDDILYGDVSGNKEVSVLDAQLVLKHVVGSLTLPDDAYTSFTLAVADVTGNGTITSYDAALILQYSIGLIPSFPVETKKMSLAKVRAGKAPEASIVMALKNDGNGELTYDLTGSNLCGFHAGEFAISCTGKSEYLSSSTITTYVKGAKLFSKFSLADNLLRVAVVSNDDIDDDAEITLVRIIVPSVTGEDKPEFTIKNALINEGAIPTRFGNGNIATGLELSDQLAGKLPMVKFFGKSVQLTSKVNEPVQLRMFDLQGRSVVRTILGAKGRTITLHTLPEGTYLYRLQQGRFTVNGRVLILEK